MVSEIGVGARRLAHIEASGKIAVSSRGDREFVGDKWGWTVEVGKCDASGEVLPGFELFVVVFIAKSNFTQTLYILQLMWKKIK